MIQIPRVCLAWAFFVATGTIFAQTDRYWSGGSPSFDNINDSRNWFGNVAPSSGDNLYFNNTTGTRHFVNNQNASDYFGNFITYNGAGGIRLTGGLTYLYKFENNNDPTLLEATATLENRGGSDIQGILLVAETLKSPT